MRFISLFGAILGCVFLAGCGDEKRAEGDVLVGISLPLSASLPLPAMLSEKQRHWR